MDVRNRPKSSFILALPRTRPRPHWQGICPQTVHVIPSLSLATDRRLFAVDGGHFWAA